MRNSIKLFFILSLLGTMLSERPAFGFGCQYSEQELGSACDKEGAAALKRQGGGELISSSQEPLAEPGQRGRLLQLRVRENGSSETTKVFKCILARGGYIQAFATAPFLGATELKAQCEKNVKSTYIRQKNKEPTSLWSEPFDNGDPNGVHVNVLETLDGGERMSHVYVCYAYPAGLTSVFHKESLLSASP